MKICGLRDAHSVDVAVDEQVNAIGFVFAPASPRFIEATEAVRLVNRIPRHIETVGVFRNQPLEDVLRISAAADVSTVQLHGDEPASDFLSVKARGLRTIRATSARAYLEHAHAEGNSAVDYLLLDAPIPGGGATFDDRDLIRSPPTHPWIMAGGLNPENVTALVQRMQPWGVDVSSGVESTRGIKDPARIRAFVAAARLV